MGHMRSTVALLGRLAMATADIAEGAAESAVGVANATVGRQVGAAQAVAAGHRSFCRCGLAAAWPPQCSASCATRSPRCW